MTKILVVDDEAAFRASLRRPLRKHGYGVSEAENGKEAIKAIAQEPPDAVLTDILMPEMEGLEFLKQLTKTHSRIPIIAMTGSVATVYLMVAKKFGARDVLEKPFTEERLLTAITKVLAKKVPEAPDL